MIIKVDREKKFYVFIQTDKPIYKPEDEVKFRILVLDKKLRPYHLNNLNVYIVDPNGEIVYELSDLSDGNHLGFIKKSYTLSKVTPLGTWKIKVVVDFLKHFPSSKDFVVQKYVLPPFDFEMKILNNKLRLGEFLNIKCDAKYSFGEHVNGNIQLTIKDLSNEKVILRKEYQVVEGTSHLNFNLTSLGIVQSKNMNFEASIKFTEPESKITLSKTEKFYVFGETTFHTKVEHQDAFIPGQRFNILVKIFDWKEDPITIKNFNDDLTIKIRYSTASGQTEDFTNIIGVHSSLIDFDYIPPENATELFLEIKYINSKPYRYTVQKGLISHFAMEGLVVSVEPKEIGFENSVNLTITGTEKMEKIIVNVITHYGNSFSAEYDCHDRTVCKIGLPIDDTMKPQSTVLVYHVRDKTHIHKGHVKLQALKLSDNRLNFEIKKDEKLEKKKNVKMVFNGHEDSTVYLLAFDKRLTYLRTGNDITRKEVDKEMSNLDTQFHTFPIDMNDKEWKDCTQEELKRVNTKRISITQQSGIDQSEMYEDTQEVDLNDDTEEAEEIETKQQQECQDEEECLLRDEFPETWLFEELKFDKQKEKLEKQFKVPHSMTTWLVSAFSLHKEYGLAIAPPQELTIKNEFFIDINLPYSIRYKEILQLDVMIYNYLSNKQSLKTIVHLNNKGGTEYEIIKADNYLETCNPTVFKNHTHMREVVVPNGNVKKISFYVRSKDTRETLPEQMNFKILAKGTDKSGNIYNDIIRKSIRVVPVGIKEHEITLKTGDFHAFNTTGKMTKKHKYFNTTTSAKSINLFISGDYVLNNLIVSPEKKHNSNPSLVEATSEIKINAEISRCNNQTNAIISDEFSKIYKDSTEKEKNQVLYHAYYADVSAIVWKIKSEAEKIGKENLKSKFNELEKLALAWLNKTEDEFNYMEEYVDPLFNVGEVTLFGVKAFTAIPFLKHQDIFKETYKDIIGKYLETLEKDYNNAEMSKSTLDLAIAAHAFALGGKYKAKLCSDLEMYKFEYDDKRCYKLKKSNKECNVILTVYMALTNILHVCPEDSSNVFPTIRWLYNKFDKDKSYSFERAITSEVFAELKKGINSKKTSLRIEIENTLVTNKQFETVEISTENARNVTQIKMSRYSKDIEYSVTGIGFWSIVFVHEFIKTTTVVSSLLALTVKVSNGNASKHIKVCGSYKDNQQTKNNELRVFYEIDIPSGYIYKNILEMKEKNLVLNITDIEVRNDKTLVIVKYLEFDRENKNCITVEASSVNVVLNQQKSTVKAYDHTDKTNLAVEYYELTTSCNNY
jgi:hypothetical protein